MPSLRNPLGVSIHISLAPFVGSLLVAVALISHAQADVLVDHFDGDSLKAQWTVSGAGGTYEIADGFLNVTSIDTAAIWADIVFAADLEAIGDFRIGIGFDYPNAGPFPAYKKFGVELLNLRDSLVARCTLEDSPSSWLELSTRSCQELIGRPTIPSWLSIVRTANDVTIEWEGYTPRTCEFVDTVATIRLVFSRYDNTAFSGVYVDSVVAFAPPYRPVISDVGLPTSQESGHVVDHFPLIGWTYHDLDSDPQQLAEVQVGSDADWTNGAEMWDVQATGDATQLLYAGQSLLDGTDYWLRVRASDGTNWSAWIETSFHMNSLPRLPTIAYPPDGGEVDASFPTLKVVVGFDAELDSQQVGFQVYVGDFLFLQESPWLPDSGASEGDTVGWTATMPLAENCLWEWTVRATDGYEVGAYVSPYGEFWVNALQEAPSIVDLRGPETDSIVYTQRPDFAWTPSADPDPNDTVQYEFRVAQDSGFFIGAEVDSLTDTALTLANPLETGRRYWWKVLSRDNHGLTAQSEIGKFRTYKPGDVNESWSLTSADIITLVNYVFKGQALAVPECAGRANGDPVVNAADIIWLVNTVFKGGPEPQAGCDLFWPLLSDS